jgi:hypothetical protein
MLLIPAALHISLSIGHVLPHGFEDWMTVATFGAEATRWRRGRDRAKSAG